jgi:uncharacterized protein YggU (UPF0235/DUF167 family)
MGWSGENSSVRILVRVKPGASRTQVRGRYDGPSGPALVVSVAARAVEGQATKAVLRAVAEVLGVRPSDVTLVRGATSRDKLLEVVGDEAGISAKVKQLLA